MLTSAFVDSVILHLSIKNVFPYLFRGEASARVVKTDMENDVGDRVRFVNHWDVVDGFGGGETQEPYDSRVWL